MYGSARLHRRPADHKYALQSIRGLLEYEASWSDITLALVDRIIMWITTSTAPNILRPATAILRKIFMSTLPASSLSQAAVASGSSRLDKGKGTVTSAASSSDGLLAGHEALRFGFSDLCERIEHVGSGLHGASGAGGVPELGPIRQGGLTSGSGATHVWKVVVKRLEGTGDLELVAQR